MRKMQRLVWSAPLLAAAWCGSAWGAELTLSPWTPGRPGISEQALLFDVEGGNSGSSAPSFLHTLPDQKELDEGPNRKTLFTGPLNDRSAYGKAWFPEPLSNAEMDLEYREAQIKYNHSESTDRQFDEIKG